MRRKLLITFLLLLICRGFVLAQKHLHDQLVDSLRAELAKATTAKDSIRLLYDLHDVSFVRDRYNVIDMLYRTAMCSGNIPVRLDALRLMANLSNGNDSLQDIQQRRAMLITSSPEQKETVVFIKMARASTAARTLTGEQMRNKLHMVLQGYKYDQQVDLYRRIELLFIICKYLEGCSTSELLFDYLKELEGLIKKLPAEPGALRSAYYTAAAIANSDAGRHAQAVESDRELLNIIHELETRHKAEGREYINYTTNYYIIYRRMLSNYEALHPGEIKDVYQKIEELKKASPDIEEDIINSGYLVDAYYYMASGNYAAALPLLQNAARLQKNRTRRLSLLQMEILAAGNLGDKSALLSAYQEYLPLVEKHFSDSEEDRLLEYQVLYDVNTLTASNADLEAQYARAEVDQHRRMLLIGGVAITVLAVILVMLFFAYRRSRRLSKNLAETNVMLTGERDTLRRIQKELIAARDKAKTAEQHKSDFINTISHEVSEPVNAIVGYSQLIVDSVEGSRRAVLERFVQIIELNAQLLNTLVNDVLDISELDNSRIVIKVKNVKLKEMCEVSADSVRARLEPGVALNVLPLTPDDAEACIDTDLLRAEQVIINLLTNATKFTDKGHINLLYGLHKDENKAEIIVEDTGPGIPKGRERKIFERFYKGSQVNQGIGLGLPICRLVSRLLGGSVYLDTEYTDGARFVFTLPITKNGQATQVVNF